jgi:hypothetical protein
MGILKYSKIHEESSRILFRPPLKCKNMNVQPQKEHIQIFFLSTVRYNTE